MFLHYLKTAFRNISRFKIQSIIVILSIALGMVFCSLTLMWIRYERSYDSFHRDADDIYLVRENWRILRQMISIRLLNSPKDRIWLKSIPVLKNMPDVRINQLTTFYVTEVMLPH